LRFLGEPDLQEGREPVHRPGLSAHRHQAMHSQIAREVRGLTLCTVGDLHQSGRLRQGSDEIRGSRGASTQRSSGPEIPGLTVTIGHQMTIDDSDIHDANERFKDAYLRNLRALEPGGHPNPPGSIVSDSDKEAADLS